MKSLAALAFVSSSESLFLEIFTDGSSLSKDIVEFLLKYTNNTTIMLKNTPKIF
jgi:hypothetical protein